MPRIKNYISGLIVPFFLTACSTNELKYDASGIFESTEIVVSAQANGEIKQLDLSEGDRVASGQCVGYVDTVQLHLQKRALESKLLAVKSRMTDVAKQVAATREQVAKAEKERERCQKLVDQNAGTQKQLDDVESQLAIARTSLEAQLSAMNSANQTVLAEQMGVEAQLEQVKDLLAKSYITSPAEGTVLEKYAERGEITGGGRPLFKLADLETLYLRAYITADQLTQIKLGQTVEVYGDFGKSEQKAYTGKVSWIASQAEFTPKTIQTRDERANLVYAVKIAVPNDGYLKIGMYGEVDFNLKRAE